MLQVGKLQSEFARGTGVGVVHGASPEDIGEKNNEELKILILVLHLCQGEAPVGFSLPHRVAKGVQVRVHVGSLAAASGAQGQGSNPWDSPCVMQ